MSNICPATSLTCRKGCPAGVCGRAAPSLMATLVMRTDDELTATKAALAASEARVKELEAGIVHRDDDVIVPEHLYLEINAAGAHWKARAEAVEQSLAAAMKLADGWIAAAERLEAGSRDFDLPADPAFVLSRENRAGTFRGCANSLRAMLAPKGEGETS